MKPILRAILVAVALASLLAGHVRAEERHTMTGVVLKVDPAARTMVVSTDKVPGFMDADGDAVFRAAGRDAERPPTRGRQIEFTYVVDKPASARREHSRARVRESGTEAAGAAPPEAAERPRVPPESRAGVLAVDQRVPEFVLTDQSRRRVALSSLAGKVVAVTFTYIRCPNPAYCFRLANNFSQLQKRFKDRLGRDLVFLTIVIDPEHDQEGALAAYARTWTTDPNVWHFLTGPMPEIKRVSHLFGVDFWGDEGSIIHSFNTAVIDRQGKLAANLEGNQFSAQQLGIVVKQMVLERKRKYKVQSTK